MCDKRKQMQVSGGGDETDNKKRGKGRPRLRSRNQILAGLQEYFETLSEDDVPTKTDFAKWLGYADIFGFYELKDRKDFSPETNKEGKDFYQILMQAWDDLFDEWLLQRGVNREGEYEGKENPISVTFTCALLNYRLGLKKIAASREVRKVDLKGDIKQDVSMHITNEMVKLADELSDASQSEETTEDNDGQEENMTDDDDDPENTPLSGIADGGSV